MSMAFRSPIYLKNDLLLALADYYDLDIPRAREITERTVSTKGGKGGIGIPKTVSLGVSGKKDVEIQASYSLEPSERATVNKIIDALIKSNDLQVDPDNDTSLFKDQLVEIEGRTRITTASLAGKMFYLVRRIIGSDDFDAAKIDGLKVDSPEVLEQLKSVYLGNEILPIPVLLEVIGSKLPQRAYVNVDPGYFVGGAEADRVEDDLRVLGSIRNLVPGGDEGYLSSEEWLLHGWEYLMRRTLMPTIGDTVTTLVDELDLDLPVDDVQAYLRGPAILIDAVAIY